MRPLFIVPLLVAASLALAFAAAAEPGPTELLERIRSTYREARTVEDGGRIEITPSDGLPRELEWTLRTSDDGRFRLDLRPTGSTGETEQRILWRTADGHASAWDRAFFLRRDVEDLAPAVAGAIGLGGLEALAIPVFLAGSDAALADPEGAALEGKGRCGDDREDVCDILYLSRMSGDLETWMWVDAEARIHRTEIVRTEPGGGFLRIRVDHAPRLGGDVDPSFQPPPETRVASSTDEWPGPIDDAALATFGEEIVVELMTASLRVVDSRGNPVPDLGPDDFRVVVEGEEIPLSAVDWVPARGTPYASKIADRLTVETETVFVEPDRTQERPVVLFFQTDVHAIRIKGHLKMLPFVEELLDGIGDGETVAVVSFDSHLKLWQDFTPDRQEAYEAVGNAIRFGNLPEPKRHRGSGPSLADALDFRAAKDAATPEQALEVLGRALGEIDGDKDVIFLGWGLGVWTSFGISMNFGDAVRELKAANTTVYVLDVTDADFHTLESGLQVVAARTGGTYAKTNRLAAQATRNLLRALAGHYVLTVDRSRLPTGEATMTVELREPPRGVRILGNPTFVG